MDSTTLTAFNEEINAHWASHFQCPVAMVQQAGTTLLPKDKYAGDKVLALWHIGAHTFVQYDPAYTQALEQVVKALPRIHRCVAMMCTVCGVRRRSNPATSVWCIICTQGIYPRINRRPRLFYVR